MVRNLVFELAHICNSPTTTFKPYVQLGQLELVIQLFQKLLWFGFLQKLVFLLAIGRTSL